MTSMVSVEVAMATPAKREAAITEKRILTDLFGSRGLSG